MKTIVITSAKSNDQHSNPVTTAKANNSTLAGKAEEVKGEEKVNGLPLGKDLAGEALRANPAKSEIITGSADDKSEVKAQAESLSKVEIKAGLVKPVLNLEGTLKLVEELHRRKIQRDKLLSTISTLEGFEVAQKDDAEETDSNHFQGCELTIEDDQRRSFSTKNPFIIKKVVEYVNTLCLDKLAEIEGEIFLPA